MSPIATGGTANHLFPSRWLINANELQVTNVPLGHGSNGEVKLGQYRGLSVAVKLPRPLQSGHESVLQSFLNECHRLSEMRHPNIVLFMGVANVDGSPALVTERMDRSLTNFLESPCGKQVSIKKKLKILQHIALGLTYLHKSRPPIVHRDLSSNNILLTANLKAKIADFGSACLYDPNMPKYTRCPRTLVYMPPEALVPVPGGNPSIDIFSFGVITVQVITGEIPNPTLKRSSEIERRSIQLKQMESVLQQNGGPMDLYCLARQCLDDVPQNRPNACDIVRKLGVMLNGEENLSHQTFYLHSLKTHTSSQPLTDSPVHCCTNSSIDTTIQLSQHFPAQSSDLLKATSLSTAKDSGCDGLEYESNPATCSQGLTTNVGTASSMFPSKSDSTCTSQHSEEPLANFHLLTHNSELADTSVTLSAASIDYETFPPADRCEIVEAPVSESELQWLPNSSSTDEESSTIEASTQLEIENPGRNSQEATTPQQTSCGACISHNPDSSDNAVVALPTNSTELTPLRHTVTAVFSIPPRSLCSNEQLQSNPSNTADDDDDDDEHKTPQTTKATNTATWSVSKSISSPSEPSCTDMLPKQSVMPLTYLSKTCKSSCLTAYCSGLAIQFSPLLQCNNVLPQLIAGKVKVKVSDCGMPKLLDANRHITPLSKCLGILPPKALKKPPVYSLKINFGVLPIQFTAHQFRVIAAILGLDTLCSCAQNTQLQYLNTWYSGTFFPCSLSKDPRGEASEEVLSLVHRSHERRLSLVSLFCYCMTRLIYGLQEIKKLCLLLKSVINTDKPCTALSRFSRVCDLKPEALIHTETGPSVSIISATLHSPIDVYQDEPEMPPTMSSQPSELLCEFPTANGSVLLSYFCYVQLARYSYMQKSLQETTSTASAVKLSNPCTRKLSEDYSLICNPLCERGMSLCVIYMRHCLTQVSFLARCLQLSQLQATALLVNEFTKESVLDPRMITPQPLHYLPMPKSPVSLVIDPRMITPQPLHYLPMPKSPVSLVIDPRMITPQPLHYLPMPKSPVSLVIDPRMITPQPLHYLPMPKSPVSLVIDPRMITPQPLDYLPMPKSPVSLVIDPRMITPQPLHYLPMPKSPVSLVIDPRMITPQPLHYLPMPKSPVSLVIDPRMITPQPLDYLPMPKSPVSLVMGAASCHAQSLVVQSSPLLQCNNVLPQLIAGKVKVKVSDCGMPKLLDANRHITPLSKCLGILPPKALKKPPVYSLKINFGVLPIQFTAHQFRVIAAILGLDTLCSCAQNTQLQYLNTWYSGTLFPCSLSKDPRGEASEEVLSLVHRSHERRLSLVPLFCYCMTRLIYGLQEIKKLCLLLKSVINTDKPCTALSRFSRVCDLKLNEALIHTETGPSVSIIATTLHSPIDVYEGEPEMLLTVSSQPSELLCKFPTANEHCYFQLARYSYMQKSLHAASTLKLSILYTTKDHSLICNPLCERGMSLCVIYMRHCLTQVSFLARCLRLSQLQATALLVNEFTKESVLDPRMITPQPLDYLPMPKSPVSLVIDPRMITPQPLHYLPMPKSPVSLVMGATSCHTQSLVVPNSYRPYFNNESVSFSGFIKQGNYLLAVHAYSSGSRIQLNVAMYCTGVLISNSLTQATTHAHHSIAACQLYSLALFWLLSRAEQTEQSAEVVPRYPQSPSNLNQITVTNCHLESSMDVVTNESQAACSPESAAVDTCALMLVATALASISETEFSERETLYPQQMSCMNTATGISLSADSSDIIAVAPNSTEQIFPSTPPLFVMEHIPQISNQQLQINYSDTADGNERRISQTRGAADTAAISVSESSSSILSSPEKPSCSDEFPKVSAMLLTYHGQVCKSQHRRIITCENQLLLRCTNVITVLLQYHNRFSEIFQPQPCTAVTKCAAAFLCSAVNVQPQHSNPHSQYLDTQFQCSVTQSETRSQYSQSNDPVKALEDLSLVYDPRHEESPSSPAIVYYRMSHQRRKNSCLLIKVPKSAMITDISSKMDGCLGYLMPVAPKFLLKETTSYKALGQIWDELTSIATAIIFFCQLLYSSEMVSKHNTCMATEPTLDACSKDCGMILPENNSSEALMFAETGQHVSITSLMFAETGQNVSITSLMFAETGQHVSITSLMFTETGQHVSITSLMFAETGQHVSITSLMFAETGQHVSITSLMFAETGQHVSITSLMFTETGQHVSITSLMFTETGQHVSITSLMFAETGQHVSITSLMFAETGQHVSITSLMFAETGQHVSITSLMFAETGQHVSITSLMFAETGQHVSITSLMFAETGQHVSITSLMFAETGQHVSITSLMFAETGQHVSITSLMFTETGQHVSITSLMFAETGQHVSITSLMFTETGQHVSITSLMFAETGQHVSITSLMFTETGQHVSITSLMFAETGQHVSITSLMFAETGQHVSITSLMFTETGQHVSITSLMFTETGQHVSITARSQAYVYRGEPEKPLIISHQPSELLGECPITSGNGLLNRMCCNTQPVLSSYMLKPLDDFPETPSTAIVARHSIKPELSTQKPPENCSPIYPLCKCGMSLSVNCMRYCLNPASFLACCLQLSQLQATVVNELPKESPKMNTQQELHHSRMLKSLTSDTMHKPSRKGLSQTSQKVPAAIFDSKGVIAFQSQHPIPTWTVSEDNLLQIPYKSRLWIMQYFPLHSITYQQSLYCSLGPLDQVTTLSCPQFSTVPTISCLEVMNMLMWHNVRSSTVHPKKVSKSSRALRLGLGRTQIKPPHRRDMMPSSSQCIASSRAETREGKGREVVYLPKEAKVLHCPGDSPKSKANSSTQSSSGRSRMSASASGGTGTGSSRGGSRDDDQGDKDPNQPRRDHEATSMRESLREEKGPTLSSENCSFPMAQPPTLLNGTSSLQDNQVQLMQDIPRPLHPVDAAESDNPGNDTSDESEPPTEHLPQRRAVPMESCIVFSNPLQMETVKKKMNDRDKPGEEDEDSCTHEHETASRGDTCSELKEHAASPAHIPKPPKETLKPHASTCNSLPLDAVKRKAVKDLEEIRAEEPAAVGKLRDRVVDTSKLEKLQHDDVQTCAKPEEYAASPADIQTAPEEEGTGKLKPDASNLLPLDTAKKKATEDLEEIRAEEPAAAVTPPDPDAVVSGDKKLQHNDAKTCPEPKEHVVSPAHAQKPPKATLKPDARDSLPLDTAKKKAVKDLEIHAEEPAPVGSLLDRVVDIPKPNCDKKLQHNDAKTCPEPKEHAACPAHAQKPPKETWKPDASNSLPLDTAKKKAAKNAHSEISVLVGDAPDHVSGISKPLCDRKDDTKPCTEQGVHTASLARIHNSSESEMPPKELQKAAKKLEEPRSSSASEDTDPEGRITWKSKDAIKQSGDARPENIETGGLGGKPSVKCEIEDTRFTDQLEDPMIGAASSVNQNEYTKNIDTSSGSTATYSASPEDAQSELKEECIVPSTEPALNNESTIETSTSVEVSSTTLEPTSSQLSDSAPSITMPSGELDSEIPTLDESENRNTTDEGIPFQERSKFNISDQDHSHAESQLVAGKPISSEVRRLISEGALVPGMQTKYSLHPQGAQQMELFQSSLLRKQESETDSAASSGSESDAEDDKGIDEEAQEGSPASKPPQLQPNHYLPELSPCSVPFSDECMNVLSLTQDSEAADLSEAVEEQEPDYLLDGVSSELVTGNTLSGANVSNQGQNPEPEFFSDDDSPETLQPCISHFRSLVDVPQHCSQQSWAPEAIMEENSLESYCVPGCIAQSISSQVSSYPHVYGNYFHY